MSDFGAKVPLTTMTQRTSARGKVYFSGLLGNATLLMFRDEAGDNEYGECWNLLIQQRVPRNSGARKPRSAPAEKPATSDLPFNDEPFLG